MKNSAFILDAINEKRNRGQEIIDLCKKEVRELSEDEQKEVDTLKEEIKSLRSELEDLKKETDALRFEEDIEEIKEEESRSEDCEEEKPQEERKLSNSTMKKDNFSLFRSIRSIVDNKPMNEVDAAVIAEGVKESRNAGVSTTGQIALPMATEKRSTITVAAEGGDLVETQIIDLLMPLRAESVLAKAGARFYSGLQGDLQVPVMSAENVFFEGEVADAQDGASGFTSVKLSPKRITAYVDVSRKALLQSTPDLEAAVVQDLGNAIAEKIEAQFLSDSSGDTNSYAGIFDVVSPTSGITAFSGLCDLEADVDDANVTGEKVYVLGNKAKATLRAMAKSAKVTQLVYENGEVDGTKAYNTSNVKKGSGKAFVYGNFNNVAVGLWAQNILVDPYTQATKSTVRIICEAWVDVKVLRPEAFATGILA